MVDVDEHQHRHDAEGEKDEEDFGFNAHNKKQMLDVRCRMSVSNQSTTDAQSPHDKSNTSI
jgi:hypothetical protein